MNILNIGDRIRNRRIEVGLSVEDVAKKLGKNRATVYRYESNDIENLPTTVLEPLSKILDTTPAQLMGWDDLDTIKTDIVKIEKGIKIPLLGEVAAGFPIFACENYEETEEISEEMAQTGQYFALRIKGDSMSPRICAGDVVIVRHQEYAETGDIVIVLINGDSATCKKLMKHSDGISLLSFNPTYEPMVYSNKEIRDLPIQIIGKVVENRQKY